MITSSTLFYAYLIASAFTAILFIIDKKLAVSGSSRISEKNLIMASLLCGWPGGLLAMKLARHKTKKLDFQVIMGLAIALNIVVLSWLTHIIGK